MSDLHETVLGTRRGGWDGFEEHKEYPLGIL